MEIGLGAPRDSIHLAEIQGKIRLVNPKTHQDLTDTMTGGPADRLKLPIGKRAFIWFCVKEGFPQLRDGTRARSPRRETPDQRGCWSFREIVNGPMAHLPVEEDGRLNDSRLRENFIERVFAYHRLDEFFGNPGAWATWCGFTQPKNFCSWPTNPRDTKNWAAWVAQCQREIPHMLFRGGLSNSRFMGALKHLATTRRHVNVLSHAAGYLRDATPRRKNDGNSSLSLGIFNGSLCPWSPPLFY
jgi:uncharacterized protein YbbK (DUF523 family)